MLKTRVNQPERVFVNSSDDTFNNNSVGFNQFLIRFNTPILKARRAQLLRATIPNAQVNIPDYQLAFWYHNLPTATTAPSAATLKCVRLYPSWFQPPAGYTTFVKNRQINDPVDFISLLNSATTTDSATFNPYWTTGDITFTYNSSTRQISFVGNAAGRFYCAAGYNDPLVNAAIAGGTLQIPTFQNAGVGTPQPLVQGWSLNLRVGYALPGTALDRQSQRGAGFNQQYANLTNTAFANATVVPVDSYPNLVYSQCVYLYSDIVAGSALGSSGQQSLLSVIPNNSPPLGVIQYVAATINWLTKVPENIHEITVTMLDDANQPFTLPDNAQVNIEFGFYYRDE